MSDALIFKASKTCPFCERTDRLRFKKMSYFENVRLMKCSSCESYVHMELDEEKVSTKTTFNGKPVNPPSYK